jgi:hypothetical protein
VRQRRFVSGTGGVPALSSMLGGTFRRQDNQGPQRLVQGIPGAVAAKVQLLQVGQSFWRLQPHRRLPKASGIQCWALPFAPCVQQRQRHQGLRDTRVMTHDLPTVRAMHAHKCQRGLCTASAPALNERRLRHLQWQRIENGHDAICHTIPYHQYRQVQGLQSSRWNKICVALSHMC